LAGEPSAKKLIQWGWGEPDTQFMRQNVKQMEQLPFDGLVFHVQTKDKENLAWLAWGPRRFQLAEFQHAIDDLAATPFTRLTERFLRVNVCPGNVDWFDDQAWGIVQQNFTVAAQVARRTGCRGFMLDTEQYEGPLFDYQRQPERKSKSFAQYQAQVRQRGRQWMEAVGGEYPEITVLLTFAYSRAQPEKQQTDRSQCRYGLLADFLDGVLEACPKTVTIVDAWEHSYPYKQRRQFDEAYQTIRQRAPEWTADPAKYRRHVQAGFGIWMDFDWRKQGWNVTDFSRNHFTPAQFEASVRSALAASDGYVWIYSEQPRWWTNERLPTAYVEALRRAKTEQRGEEKEKDQE
jgi:hypothetical protein